MAVYKTGLVVRDVLETHRRFDELLTRLAVAKSPIARRMRGDVLAAYAQFNRDLEQLAQRTSVAATRHIQQQLKRTAKRPDNRLRPHIKDSIVCRPTGPGGFRIPTGWVGIADIEELDKVVNPLTPQYGPYWRTQEDGFAGHQGRKIHGLFFGPGLTGGGERPASAFKGGGGPHPIFVAGPGGAGTIDEPIQARHFIERGAREAGRDWLAQLQAVESRAIARLP